MVEISTVLVGTFWGVLLGVERGVMGGVVKRGFYAFLEEGDGFGCAGGAKGSGVGEVQGNILSFRYFLYFILEWGVYVVGESGWVMGWPMR